MSSFENREIDRKHPQYKVVEKLGHMYVSAHGLKYLCWSLEH